MLISRLYRHDLKRSIADVFRIHVLSSTDIRSPITTLGSTTFFHVKRDNIYIVAVTKVNANAALVFEFLHRLVDGIGRSYFGKMDEEGVKNNFVLIYELLDEILDFGYPQNSDIDALKMYITTESIKSERAVVLPPYPLPCLYYIVLICVFEERRFIENYNTGDRRNVIPQNRHQIPSKRSLCRRNRKRKSPHVRNRNFPSSRRFRTNHDASIPHRNTRMSIRS